LKKAIGFLANVKGQYASQKEKGKKFLVNGIDNYEIYSLAWDDVFMMFDLRHKFVVDHLDFDKAAIKRELLEKGLISTTILARRRLRWRFSRSISNSCFLQLTIPEIN